MLLGAVFLSLLVGEKADALAIGAVVVLNALVGFSQEYRAERAMEALRRLLAPRARVLRGGQVREIPAREVVPGDVLLVEAGEVVAADARVAESPGIELDESLLTGESLPVLKGSGDFIFTGTGVVRGKAKAVVTAKGIRTRMGAIARMVGRERAGKTPLQRRMEALGKYLAGIGVAAALAVAAAGFLRGEELFLVVLTGISLAVAAVPESLPTVVTLVLAIGAQRMFRRRAVIRKLGAVETLGSATVICADKTGTLTRNELSVAAVWAGAKEGEELWKAAVLSSPEVTADPLETALFRAARERGYNPSQWREGREFLGEAPFDSRRKMASFLFREGEGDIRLYAKGAPEEILRRSASVRLGEGEVPLDGEWRREIEARFREMAARALRVLALAERRVSPGEGELPSPFGLEEELTFLGLVGFRDPPRPEAAAAVALCHSAGVEVKMITGDHPDTARQVAEEVGLLPGGEVVTGEELESWGEEELLERVGRARVFARTPPEAKLRIVRALRRRGEVVAMTGDGVNDAPALREADIGVAMGRSGSEVAREAADMVLADDHFATIVAAVEEGRVIYENIRRAVVFLLGCNGGEVMLMMLAAALGWPLPLLPSQILLVNLVTDGPPALALGVERAERGIMSRPPHPPGESIFARGLGARAIVRGLSIALVGLLAFGSRVGGEGGVAEARTLTMAVLSGSQLLYALECHLGTGYPLSNPWFFLSLFLSGTVIWGVVELPFLGSIFRVASLEAGDWVAVGLFSLLASLLGRLGERFLRLGTRR